MRGGQSALPYHVRRAFLVSVVVSNVNNVKHEMGIRGSTLAILIGTTEYPLDASSQKLRILFQPSNSKKKSQVRTPLFSVFGS
jgi:hypothetical protein